MIFPLGLSRLDFLLLLFPTRHFAPKHFFSPGEGRGGKERDGGTGIPDPAQETGPVAFYSFLGEREESYGFAFPKKGAKNKFLTKSRKKKGHYERKVIALRVFQQEKGWKYYEVQKGGQRKRTGHFSVLPPKGRAERSPIRETLLGRVVTSN